MSVQFGRWNFEGQPPAPDYIEKVSKTLASLGPDSNESYSKSGIRILYRAFHTTKESLREKQPCISASGAVITWDGRLDNRADLISELRDSLTVNSADLAIVAAAYEKWGANCLGRLIGDWALSIWNPRERSVLLAKDPIGTKHLFYSFDNKTLTWSTILDPLVLFAGKTFEICEEYIAGWFAISVFPAAHLTPYVGVHSVPPSSSVLLSPGKHIVSKYWDFDPGKRIRYRTDAEYEENFRSALATAVQRRLRSDRPVLAELSGGMDSSSIVCMADLVMARNAAECPRLDTISWFDDSYDHVEPDSNELHWISKVEQKRRRAGFHINTGALQQVETKELGSRQSFEAEFDNDRFAATPIPNNRQSGFFKCYKACVQSQGYRVTLSGIGGDEPTGGGVPTPTPELQNLLARLRFVTLARQLNAWAAKMRRQPLPLLWEAVQGFFSAPIDLPKETRPDSCLRPDFLRRNHAAFCGYPSRVKLFASLPSFQEHIDKLEANRRFAAYCSLTSELLREARHPYYDRDFLEFMYAIPWEQIVRVGQRRSLMKRALVGIVPDELLTRRRKTFVPPEQKQESATEWPTLVETGQYIIGSSVGIIDPDRFAKALQKARHNEDVSIGSLKRTATLESWLRHLATQGVLTNSMVAKRRNYSPLPEVKELQAQTQPKSLAS
jgi:asparagine synthase (glutamine-hydrolysing)